MKFVKLVARLSIISILSVFAFASASAQAELELFAGGYDPGSELTATDFDNGALFGFRLGHSFTPLFASEFSYTFVNNLQEKRKIFEGRAHLLNGNLLLQVPVGRTVPFITAGIGNIIGQSNQFLRLKNSFAWNAGGGLKIHSSGPLGIRVDVRYYKVADGVELSGVALRKANFDFAEVSGGVVFRF